MAIQPVPANPPRLSAAAAPRRSLAQCWLRRLLERLAPRVPTELAVCEFDCRRPQCVDLHWRQCRRRLGQISDAFAVVADERS